jgi:hypothetical protein
MKSKEKLKKKEICYCNKCASPIRSKEHAYTVPELYIGQIVNIIVCSECNDEHQAEMKWSINHQLYE